MRSLSHRRSSRLSPFLPMPLACALSLAFASMLSASPHSPSGIKTFEDETPAGGLHRATLGYGRKIRVELMSGLCARLYLFCLAVHARIHEV
ncbi:hypothetical protein PUN28_011674 [Cardiocondyla obscurior]|uniref:Secreted protein n=1 Tax=Cardiocondyla obscurior TaxID=286306 RepID=A0AAW2FKR5_9HYME